MEKHAARKTKVDGLKRRADLVVLVAPSGSAMVVFVCTTMYDFYVPLVYGTIR
jgi:hypothetical protein